MMAKQWPDKSKPFKWRPNREEAVRLLALGNTEQKTAEKLGLKRDTIKNWKKHPEFRKAIDEMQLEVGIARKAERLRIAQRAVDQLVSDDGVKTSADLLDWLKFVEKMKEGDKVDITSKGKQLSTNIIIVREEVDD